MKKWVYHIFYERILGWRIEGSFPKDDKFVVIVMPHTSNWDIFLGFYSRTMTGVNVRFVGKHTLFVFPFGILFRWLGGYPINRGKNQNYVDAIVDIFEKEKEFKLCITPEGTRSSVTKIKTGFYHIAKKANLPISLVRFHFPDRLIDILPPFYPTDDMEADMEFILKSFRGTIGKNRPYEL